MTLRLEAAGITHKGTVRENNEDCIAVGFWISQETMNAANHFDHVLDQLHRLHFRKAGHVVNIFLRVESRELPAKTAQTV